MPRWLSRLREGARGADNEIALPAGGIAVMERLSERAGVAALELPPGLPPGIDGALWASWAARWQEF